MDNRIVLNFMWAIFLSLVMSIASSNLAAQEASSTSQKITVIYVSNLPNIADTEKGGLAQVSTMVNAARTDGTPVLFLHGGDSLAPSTLAAFDKGSHMIDVLNAIEPTAMAVA